MKIEKTENDGRQWYQITGIHDGTGCEFNNDEFGICEDGTIIDADGYPLTPGDWQTIAVENLIG